MHGLAFRLRIFLLIMVAVMVTGTVGFMIAEKQSPLDAVYFAVVTITTVGYGDIHPSTAVGKMLVLVLILSGVGTFTGLVANGTELLLNHRDRRIRNQKLNMVVGLFFSEMGTGLLKDFTAADENLGEIKELLKIGPDWTPKDFVKAKKRLAGAKPRINTGGLNIESLREFLDSKGNLLLRLLENPILLEQESFAELLRALFHLREELFHRIVGELDEAAIAHLAGDIQRVYGLMIPEWLDYMFHLKENYPYLFALALSRNPFLRS